MVWDCFALVSKALGSIGLSSPNLTSGGGGALSGSARAPPLKPPCAFNRANNPFKMDHKDCKDEAYGQEVQLLTMAVLLLLLGGTLLCQHASS